MLTGRYNAIEHYAYAKNEHFRCNPITFNNRLIPLNFATEWMTLHLMGISMMKTEVIKQHYNPNKQCQHRKSHFDNFMFIPEQIKQ